MKIKEILAGVETTGIIPAADIKEIYCDSRQCTPGSLFVAVRGAEADGHNYIGKAIEKGASYVVCEELPQELDPQVGYGFL